MTELTAAGEQPAPRRRNQPTEDGDSGAGTAGGDLAGRGADALQRAKLDLEEMVRERTEALQRANCELEHYKRIVASTPDLISLVDRAYTYRIVNDSYLQSFGKQRQEIVGQTVADLLGETGFEAHVKPHLDRAFAGQTVRYERWFSFPVAGRRLCAVTYHPVPDRDGHIGHVAVNVRDITEGKLAKDDRLRIFNASPDLMCVIGFDGCIRDFNPAWTRILGWSADQLHGRPWLELVHPDDIATTIEADERLLLGQQTTGFENRLCCKNGKHRWVSWNFTADLDRQETFAVARDITDSKLLQEALKSSVRKYRTFFDFAGDAVFVHDFSGRLLDVNRVACERLGYSRDELLRMPAADLAATATAIDDAQLLQKIEQDGEASFEAHHRAKNGSELLVWTNARRIEYDGLPAVLSIARDYSERKRMENELRNQATTDPLTGANNRRYFIDRGGEELSRSRRYKTSLCLLLLDIDHFKQINDTYGHDAGDEILRGVTQRCHKALRESDLFARLGGEEFAALLIETGRQDALLTAERLRAAIQDMSFPQISDNLAITISIGVALFDTADLSLEEVMKRADQAMYRAKQNGRNCVVLY